MTVGRYEVRDSTGKLLRLACGTLTTRRLLALYSLAHAHGGTVTDGDSRQPKKRTAGRLASLIAVPGLAAKIRAKHIPQTQLARRAGLSKTSVAAQIKQDRYSLPVINAARELLAGGAAA